MDYNSTDPGLITQVATKSYDVYQSLSSWQITLFTIFTLLLLEQIRYVKNKGTIAGPALKLYPIIGPFLESLNPKFEEYLAKWNSGPLSCVEVFHKFVVIASTRDLSRKILSSPKYVKPCLVDVAIKILRPSNWVFLDGQEHADYRKALNGLFTPAALEDYLPIQEKCIDEHLDLFLSYKEPKKFFDDFREMLCALSLKTFCGDYITEDQIKMIADNYYKITAALELVNFPIIIPYTKTWYGKKIAHETMLIFQDCADRAKKDIANGSEPNSLMEKWIYQSKQAKLNKLDSEDAKYLTREFTSKEISEAVFTFLFASQDASSSLACWLFQIVSDRPDIANKVREEQLRIRNNDLSVGLSLDLINEMKYTNAVVKECLRYRPPVTMVPYVAKQEFPITKDYNVPKGAMIIPTFYPSLHDPEIYENPDDFIPERWYEATDNMLKRNYLVFGYGAHACIGKNYVYTLFAGLLGKALLKCDLTHYPTELSEEIEVFATIFPKDHLTLKWNKYDPFKKEVIA